jgi:tight adherence protein C
MLILVPVFAGLAIFFFMRALLQPGFDAHAAQLERIAGSGAGATIELDPSGSTLWERLLRPLAAGTADRLGSLLPARLAAHFEDELSAAGNPVGAGAFTGALLVLPPSLVLLAVLVFARTGGGVSPAMFLGALVGGALGIGMPLLWLRTRVERRQNSIVRDLPDTFDMIVVSVEAGLGFEAAIARVTDNTEGPLTEELRRLMLDMNLGMGRRRALQSMAARTRALPVKTLVSAIIQADQTGMGIGQVLRAQAEHLRTQRRQNAEQRAMKAPLKMLFPLVFFIFPALFVVLLGPAAISIAKTLGDST